MGTVPQKTLHLGSLAQASPILVRGALGQFWESQAGVSMPQQGLVLLQADHMLHVRTRQGGGFAALVTQWDHREGVSGSGRGTEAQLRA